MIGMADRREYNPNEKIQFHTNYNIETIRRQISIWRQFADLFLNWSPTKVTGFNIICVMKNTSSPGLNSKKEREQTKEVGNDVKSQSEEDEEKVLRLLDAADEKFDGELGKGKGMKRDGRRKAETPSVNTDGLAGSSGKDRGGRKASGEDKSLWGEDERPRLCCSYRMLISFGGFLAFFNATLIRLGMVMAMVCMSKSRSRNVTSDPDCPDIESEENSNLYEFTWSSSLQGVINSGGFYGFLIGPFIGGFLSFRFGGKIILVIATFCSGLTYLFIPQLTRLNPYCFFAVRIVSGFFGGWLFPSGFDILSRWTVPNERQLLVGGALIGVPTFAVLNYPINGMVCTYIGWVWIFYMSAIWLTICSAFFYFFVYDSPEKCPHAKREVDYILPRTPGRASDVKVPWRKIFRSLPVHAYIITHFCMNYGLITVIIHLPMFMREVHHFQLSSNSFLSASPYIGALFCRIITTFTFEKLRSRLRVTKTVLRKSFVFVGVFFPSVSLIVISLLSCRYRYATIAFFILFSITLELSFSSGYLLSLMDMCPSYNNILSGFANAVANLAGLSSALLTGFSTPNGTSDEWNRTFYVSIAFFVVAGFSYILFGTSELQPWGMVNKGGTDRLKKESAISQSSIV